MYVFNARGHLPECTNGPVDTYADTAVQHAGVYGGVLFDDTSGATVGGVQGADVVVALGVAYACGGLSAGFFGGGGLNFFLVRNYIFFSVTVCTMSKTIRHVTKPHSRKRNSRRNTRLRRTMRVCQRRQRRVRNCAARGGTIPDMFTDGAPQFLNDVNTTDSTRFFSVFPGPQCLYTLHESGMLLYSDKQKKCDFYKMPSDYNDMAIIAVRNPYGNRYHINKERIKGHLDLKNSKCSLENNTLTIYNNRTSKHIYLSDAHITMTMEQKHTDVTLHIIDSTDEAQFSFTIMLSFVMFPQNRNPVGAKEQKEIFK